MKKMKSTLNPTIKKELDIKKRSLKMKIKINLSNPRMFKK